MVAACGRDLTAPITADPVHDVLITVTIPGHCIFGGCDPPGGGRTTLALVRVLNTGNVTAYLQACGTQAAMREQQLVDGQWQFVGPAVTCPVTPGPIMLARGDSVQVNWFFASGTRRIVLGVAGDASMSDEALDASAAFVVP